MSILTKGNYLEDYYNQYLKDEDLNILNILNPNIKRSVLTYLGKQTVYADQLIPISNLAVSEVTDDQVQYRITAKSGTGFKGAFDFTLNKVTTKTVINVRVSDENERLSFDTIADRLTPIIKRPEKLSTIIKNIYKVLGIYFYEEGKETILVPTAGCAFANASVDDNSIYLVILYWDTHYQKYLPVGVEPSADFDLDKYIHDDNIFVNTEKQLDYYFPYKDRITDYYNNQFDLTHSKLRILFCPRNTHYIYKQQDILEITIGK